MKKSMVYWSQTGNTESNGYIIGEGLKSTCDSCVKTVSEVSVEGS